MNNLYSIENSNEEAKRLSGRFTSPFTMFAHESTMHWIIEHHQPIVAYTLSLCWCRCCRRQPFTLTNARNHHARFAYFVIFSIQHSHTYDRVRIHLYIHTCNGLEWNGCSEVCVYVCEYRLTSDDSFRSDRRHCHTVCAAIIFLYSTLLFYHIARSVYASIRFVWINNNCAEMNVGDANMPSIAYSHSHQPYKTMWYRLRAGVFFLPYIFDFSLLQFTKSNRHGNFS